MDAYRRYRLDMESSYYLQPAITLMFLLVQIASLFFLVGLVIQSITDQTILGYTTLAFCVLGAVIYSVVILLPHAASLSSFRNPLSDLIQSLKIVFGRAGPQWASKIDECLGEIFYTHLIMSPDPSRVDAAAAEIADPRFKEESVQSLCLKEAPERMLTRFRRLALAPADDRSIQNESLSNYLLSFLRFAHHFEIRMQTLETDPARFYTLRKLLEPGYPLHQLNSLVKPLLSLQLSLKIELHCLSRKLPDADREPRCIMDFHQSEMDDLLWEVSLEDILPGHRQRLILAACCGVLQGVRSGKNLKVMSANVLSLCLAEAYCALSAPGTTNWVQTVQDEEHDIVKTLAPKVLPQLYVAMMTGSDDIVTTPLLDTPSLATGMPHRTLWTHTIRMLSQHPGLNADLFNPESIDIISYVVVFEDRDVREDGLRLLASLGASSERTMPQLTSALVAKVGIGLKHESQSQSLGTIEFVSAIWKDSTSPFNSVPKQSITNLVEVALSTDSMDVRRRALSLAKDVWARTYRNSAEYTSKIKAAIEKVFIAGLDHLPSGNCDRILADLTEVLKKDGPSPPPYAFAWDSNLGFIQDIFPVLFEKIVTTAIHDADGSVREKAQSLLKELSKGNLVRGPIDALRWLKTAQPSGWWVPHNTMLVWEVFIKQLDLRVGLDNEALLEKLAEWASTGFDELARLSSVKLISTICQERTGDLELDMVEFTIISVKDRIIREMSFPTAIPIILELWTHTQSVTDLWEDAPEDLDVTSLFKGSTRPEYIEALKRALPRDLKPFLRGLRASRPTTVKWIKLMAALRSSLTEVVGKVLRGIANDVKDVIKGSLTEYSGSDSGTQEPQVKADGSKDDGECLSSVSSETM
ncbi:hypothetical protein H1R20_g3388, partial [Candolleomyces eurysporus]